MKLGCIRFINRFQSSGPLDVRQIIDTAQTLNPGIEVVLRTNIEDEAELLRKDNIGTVFFGKEELAKSMTNHDMERFDP